jgi:hypothetical protein
MNSRRNLQFRLELGQAVLAQLTTIGWWQLTVNRWKRGFRQPG